MQQLVNMGGSGGIIAADRTGQLALTFNTPGMYRGYLKAGEEPAVAIFGVD